jgi:hypothetical protein
MSFFRSVASALWPLCFTDVACCKHGVSEMETINGTIRTHFSCLYTFSTCVSEELKNFEFYDCNKAIKEMEKGSFVSAGLKLKKALGPDWTDQMNSQFKS